MEETDVAKIVQDAIEKDRAYLRFAQEQAKENREYFTTIFNRTAGFITALTVVAGALGYGSFTAIRDQSKSLVDSEIKRSQAELSATVLGIKAQSQAQLDEVKSSVQKRVADEFETKNITDIVVTVAKERTSKELTGIIRSETASQVAQGIKRESPTIRNVVVAETKRAVQDLQPTITATTGGGGNGRFGEGKGGFHACDKNTRYKALSCILFQLTPENLLFPVARTSLFNTKVTEPRHFM